MTCAYMLLYSHIKRNDGERDLRPVMMSMIAYITE